MPIGKGTETFLVYDHDPINPDHIQVCLVSLSISEMFQTASFLSAFQHLGKKWILLQGASVSTKIEDAGWQDLPWCGFHFATFYYEG